MVILSLRKPLPMRMEFHISRVARDQYQFDEMLFATNGNVIFANFQAARTFAQRMNQQRDVANYPERAVRAGQINAMGLVDEILHHIVAAYRRERNPRVMRQALDWLGQRIGAAEMEQTLRRFSQEFPPVSGIPGRAQPGRIPGRRDRRDAEPGSRAGRDDPALAGQRQPGLRTVQ